MATALILAAGKATRLVGLRDRYAKATLPVGDTTPLRFLLEALGEEFEEIWINLHYKAEQVREHAQRYAAQGVRLHFLEEEVLLGTGGTLLAMARRVGTVPELLVNAKLFTDFPFGCMKEVAPGTMVLHAGSPLEAYGGLRFNSAKQILGLVKKGGILPSRSSAAVFSGICHPHSHWLDALENARRLDSGSGLCLVRHGLLPALDRFPGHATAWLHGGHWLEISTPKRVALASSLLGELKDSLARDRG